MTINYNPTGNPVSGTRGVASVMRDEFNLISQAVNNKIDQNNPVALQPPPGDNSSRIATTAFVNNTFITATLPPQAGNAGRFLSTNGSTTNWSDIRVTRNPQSSAYTIQGTDRGVLVDFTGTVTTTFSFQTTAVLGNGWFCYVRNSGTATLILDPAGSELINGATSVTLPSGSGGVVQSTGTEFFVLQTGVPFSFQEFTTSGIWIRPAGVSVVYVEAIGGGGSGAASNTGGVLTTGGAGGTGVSYWYLAEEVPAHALAVIGAGGVGVLGNAADVPGNTGGASLFHNLAAYGGVGGRRGVNMNIGSAFFDHQTWGDGIGDVMTRVATGISPFASGFLAPQYPSPGVFGGGPGSSVSAANTLISSLWSMFAGAGGNATAVNVGVAGGFPGGGGSAAINGGTSGAGAPGRVRVWAW